MAKAPQQTRAAPAEREAPIVGEVVESTERALAAMSVNAPATMDSSMVAILTRAELDQMVVTARANPRSIQRALEATKEIACLNLQAASESSYSLPRGRDDTTGKANVITGPSVRLAEIVACQWGNCQAASRVTEVNRTEGWVEAEGVFIDFQTNYRVTSRVRRSIKGRSGKVFGDDMINVTSNAAAAIAFRNAVFKGVPKPIWNTAYEETQKIVRGDEKSLGARRVDLLTAFKENLKIKAEQVYAILGVKGEQDIGLDELVVAAGFYSALKNNEITVEDLIRQIQPAAAGKSLGDAYTGTGPKTDPPSGQGKEAAQATPAAAETVDPDTGEVHDGPRLTETGSAQPADAAQASSASATPAPTDSAAATSGPSESSGRSGAHVDDKTGAVVAEGPAPPEVVHFLADATALDPQGRMATFKNGERFSSAKPSANIPTYEALTPVADEAEHAEGSDADQGDAHQEAIDRSNGEAGEGADEGESNSQPSSDALPGDDAGVDADAGDDGEAQELTDFRERIGTLDSWLTIKAALSALRKTDAYAAAPETVQTALRKEAFLVVQTLRDTGRDPVNPATDPAFYALWVEFIPRDQVGPAWSALVRTKAYQALNEQQKDALGDLTERAKGEL